MELSFPNNKNAAAADWRLILLTRRPNRKVSCGTLGEIAASEGEDGKALPPLELNTFTQLASAPFIRSIASSISARLAKPTTTESTKPHVLA